MKVKVFRYEVIDSTNEECFRKFNQKQLPPFGIVARTQTQGRGQFDRTWYSDDPQNLYISFGFVPRQSLQEFQNFSIVVAKKIVAHLQSTFDIELEVKHPNDIYACGRKMGGVLTESRVVNDIITFAVTGIGLNVAGDLSKFPRELQSQAITLSDVCQTKISLQTVETQVITIMESLL
ncbi:MAG: biotin--[acetyl-CoA-carboxylase] ligase [Puniceicoccales bacterium]|jgi:BirA family biotin operon repressor/biotin-[acetyl-CoA-carboxylase] ligase|nr:biotin--[acetyl-CoA-carboxylase] ligase [Puniceicoccales bacterium]